MYIYIGHTDHPRVLCPGGATALPRPLRVFEVWYIYIYIHTCIYLSIYRPLYLSIYLSLSLSIYIYVYIHT